MIIIIFFFFILIIVFLIFAGIDFLPFCYYLSFPFIGCLIEEIRFSMLLKLNSSQRLAEIVFVIILSPFKAFR